jgi:hypothetical protein
MTNLNEILAIADYVAYHDPVRSAKLRTLVAEHKALREGYDKLIERSVGAMAIAEGNENWQKIPIDCPMLEAVSLMRIHVDNLEALREALESHVYCFSDYPCGSGYRLTIGFDSLEKLQAAHQAVADASKALGGAK